jgi:hypothetical protein
MTDRLTHERAYDDTVADASGHTEIEALAYQLWLERGCPAGSPEQDWFRAEKQLSAPREITRAAGAR